MQMFLLLAELHIAEPKLPHPQSQDKTPATV